MTRVAAKKPAPVKKPTQDKEVVQAVKKEVNSVKIRSKATPLRNPYTGAMFTKRKSTDVIDLDDKDNTWTRFQLEAGVLEIV